MVASDLLRHRGRKDRVRSVRFRLNGDDLNRRLLPGFDLIRNFEALDDLCILVLGLETLAEGAELFPFKAKRMTATGKRRKEDDDCTARTSLLRDERICGPLRRAGTGHSTRRGSMMELAEVRPQWTPVDASGERLAPPGANLEIKRRLICLFDGGEVCRTY